MVQCVARCPRQGQDSRTHPSVVLGNRGDSRPVGHGISELRIDYGPGYRVYFVHQGATLVILLAGGDKGTQRQDIAQARELAQRL